VILHLTYPIGLDSFSAPRHPARHQSFAEEDVNEFDVRGVVRKGIADELNDPIDLRDHRCPVAHAVVVIAQAQLDALLVLLLRNIEAAS
jgi:hypothetical protein